MGKMKLNKFILYVALSFFAAVSCKSQYDLALNSSDVNFKFDTAMEYFEEGKYLKAASVFESLSVMSSGMPMDDTVQYYWGLSNYRFQDYYTAETNFNQFILHHPSSPFTEDARFLRIDCLYRQTLRYELDQNPTYLAINAINEYLREFPANDHLSDCEVMLNDLSARLDRKAYEAARLYYRMEEYKSSRVALRNVLKDDSENIYREDILYYIAMSSYKYANLSVRSKQRERYLVFVDDYLNFIGEIPESPYRKELDMLYAKVQKFLGNYTGEVEMQDKDEKAFDRARRAAEKSELKKNEL